MNTPKNGYERIVLGDKAANRDHAYLGNKRLLLAHKLLLLCILTVFIHVVITDSNYISEYSESKLTFVVGMTAWFVSALFLSYLIMWFPALFFAKAISPEILLTQTDLIYLPCSISLNYGMLGVLHRPLIYLLGYDMAQRISRDQIISVTIEKTRFLKPGFGLGDQIVIKHKAGSFSTGIWLRQYEKLTIAERLNDWIK